MTPTKAIETPEPYPGSLPAWPSALEEQCDLIGRPNTGERPTFGHRRQTPAKDSETPVLNRRPHCQVPVSFPPARFEVIRTVLETGGLATGESAGAWVSSAIR